MVIGIVILLAMIGAAVLRYLKSRNMVRVIKIYEFPQAPQSYKEKMLDKQKKEKKKKEKSPSDDIELGAISPKSDKPLKT